MQPYPRVPLPRPAKLSAQLRVGPPACKVPKKRVGPISGPVSIASIPHVFELQHAGPSCTSLSALQGLQHAGYAASFPSSSSFSTIAERAHSNTAMIPSAMAGRPGRQLEAEAEALKGAARLEDLNLWPMENGDANHS